MENQGKWETDEAQEIAWLDEAFGRIRDDISCAAEHWERAKMAAVTGDTQEQYEEMYGLVKHFENAKLGVDICHATFVERFCSAEVVAQLVIDKIQQQTGEEYRIVSGVVEADGVGGFLLERQSVDVPDDLSELDGDE